MDRKRTSISTLTIVAAAAQHSTLAHSAGRDAVSANFSAAACFRTILSTHVDVALKCALCPPILIHSLKRAVRRLFRRWRWRYGMIKTLGCLMLAVAGVAGAARGDVVIKNDGSKVEGKIIQEDANVVVVQ